jgi:hypothetical protein
MSDLKSCTCVTCGECKGSGTVWFSFGSSQYGGGQYLGNHRGDDLDEMTTCEECGGSGLSEVCELCQEAADLHYDEYFSSFEG